MGIYTIGHVEHFCMRCFKQYVAHKKSEMRVFSWCVNAPNFTMGGQWMLQKMHQLSVLFRVTHKHNKKCIKEIKSVVLNKMLENMHKKYAAKNVQKAHEKKPHKTNNGHKNELKKTCKLRGFFPCNTHIFFNILFTPWEPYNVLMISPYTSMYNWLKGVFLFRIQ